MERNENFARTSVEVPTLRGRDDAAVQGVFLGSCFSQYMGERMRMAGFQSCVNPTGTLFNPASISLLLRAMDDESLAEASVFYAEADSEWRSWLADTRLKALSPEACKVLLVERLRLIRLALTHATHLFITLGTCVCYRLVADGHVVTNCHRQPDRLFREVRLSERECVEALEDIIQRVRSVNPNMRIVFTVSPYRYRKYGLHTSQLAKATLLLAVEKVCDLHPHGTAYFPAYELMMDELRDYHFYADDAVHPSVEAQDYIWEKLKRSLML
ncbi:MAG: GSCFA domain-containing protein [Bacteroidaceae bacterium]|nr:GSCFA domain-containing protein [Bacteroidaceae bacterium]